MCKVTSRKKQEIVQGADNRNKIFDLREPFTGITQESLYSLTRSREGARGRSTVAYLARVVSGWMIKDVARHFRRSPMVMSQARIRIEGELGKDQDLREMIEKLKTGLIQKAKKKYFITIA
jgi:chromosomal replication initiation ATPase DnaA